MFEISAMTGFPYRKPSQSRVPKERHLISPSQNFLPDGSIRSVQIHRNSGLSGCFPEGKYNPTSLEIGFFEEGLDVQLHFHQQQGFQGKFSMDLDGIYPQNNGVWLWEFQVFLFKQRKFHPFCWSRGSINPHLFREKPFPSPLHSRILWLPSFILRWIRVSTSA